MCRPPLPLALLALAVGTSSQVVAQGVDLRFAVANLGHELIGNVNGPVLHVAIPVGGPGTALLLGASRLTGASNRFGVPCGGLIDPGACRPELLRDRGSVTALAVGVTTPARAPGRIRVRLRGDLGVVRLESRTSTVAGGLRLSAGRTMWQAAASSEFYWQPVKGLPVSLVGAGTFGRMIPLPANRQEDGYEPFERSLGVSQISFGVVWGGQ